jgi:hypothetical protein
MSKNVVFPILCKLSMYACRLCFCCFVKSVAKNAFPWSTVRPVMFECLSFCFWSSESFKFRWNLDGEPKHNVNARRNVGIQEEIAIQPQCIQLHTRKNLTTCHQEERSVRNRLVASLSTSCNNAVISSSCYKVGTHNLLLTNCWITGR